MNVRSPSRLDAAGALPPFAAAFDALVARVGAATPPEKMAALHRAFERRTGAFGPDDPWFESRSRAFWDDTMTRQQATQGILDVLDGGERLWAAALPSSHRGLFHSRIEDGVLVLSDVLRGGDLVVHEVDEASRDALGSTAGLFDGTVVALRSPVRLALLPGAIFHPEEAEDAIGLVVAAARTRSLPDDAVLDALLRMELSLRTLSRVKPGYAYRVGALG